MKVPRSFIKACRYGFCAVCLSDEFCLRRHDPDDDYQGNLYPGPSLPFCGLRARHSNNIELWHHYHTWFDVVQEATLGALPRAVAVIGALLALGCLSCCHGHEDFREGYYGEAPFFIVRAIFLPGDHGAQCHSSTLTELSNGDILAAWWSGSYEGATDAVIKLARLRPEQSAWDGAETAVDIPDRFEGNPVLSVFPDGAVRLFLVVVDPEAKGRVQIMFRRSDDQGHTWGSIERFITELGIRTRNRPLIMANGEILLPLFDHLTDRSVFLASGDGGKTWSRSSFIVSDPGNCQPAVISRRDGSLYALMRTWNDDPSKRFLWQTESHDYGMTWQTPSYSSVPSVDSAVDMITLRNGHVVLVFNDGRYRERTPLTLALSLDEGRTWAL